MPLTNAIAYDNLNSPQNYLHLRPIHLQMHLNCNYTNGDILLFSKCY